MLVCVDSHARDGANGTARCAHAWRSLLPLRPGGLLESTLLVLLACCISLGQGQDANWDLRNYHLYNPYSLLNGRFEADLNAVGIQTYLNPLLDLPYYLLSMHLLANMPRAVAFLAGIPFGLLIVIVLRIARTALPGTSESWLPPIATALGVTGTMTWSEIGTTCGDIPIAVIVLTGLSIPLAWLPHRATMRTATWLRAAAAAGLLIGGAAGLKLTACIYAPGALVALSLTSGDARRAVGTAFAFCAGWAAGLLLVDGWWLLMLYQRFDNPVFPQLNQYFDSPWLPAHGMEDLRFLPRGAPQALFYPFFWLHGGAGLVTELSFSDPRYALAYATLVGLTGVELLRRLGIARTSLPAVSPVAAALALFTAVSYAVWEAEFSILRYAIGMEALTGIIIVLGVRAVAAAWRRPAPSARQIQILCGALMVATVALSSRPDWGRLPHYGATTFNIDASAIPRGATIVLADKPLGFALPFLRGEDISIVGITDPTDPGRLQDSLRARVAHGDPVLVLIDQPPASYAAVMHSYGRRIDEAACTPIRNPFDKDVALCVAVAAP
jgi:hypothetical protein